MHLSQKSVRPEQGLAIQFRPGRSELLALGHEFGITVPSHRPPFGELGKNPIRGQPVLAVYLAPGGPVAAPVVVVPAPG